MEQTDSDQREGRRGVMVERRDQRTCMNDPQTWTTGWEVTAGVGDGVGEGGQREKYWDNCNKITIKMIEK